MTLGREEKSRGNNRNERGNEEGGLRKERKAKDMVERLGILGKRIGVAGERKEKEKYYNRGSKERRKLEKSLETDIEKIGSKDEDCGDKAVAKGRTV